MIIEKKIEDGIKAILTVRTYVTANSIPVRNFGDNTGERVQKYLVAHCGTAERIAPNFNMWKMECEIIAITHIPNDENRAVLNAMYQDAMSAVHTMTPASLSTSSGLTVDGIVPKPGGEEMAENYQMKILRFDVFLTLAPT